MGYIPLLVVALSVVYYPIVFIFILLTDSMLFFVACLQVALN